jgi:hypothetical protein
MGEAKMSFLVMDGEECNYIWKNLCDLQLIFHPSFSKEGVIDYKTLSNLKNRKKIYVVLDRNLLTSLLKLSRDGYLKNENEMRIIALLMTWIFMNHLLVSPGLALKEYATKINSVISYCWAKK